MEGVKLVRTVRKIVPRANERSLLILDIDMTLINGQMTLVDPLTPEWIRSLLPRHDILICTYRDSAFAEYTEEQFKNLGLEAILNQNILFHPLEGLSCQVRRNIIYTQHKGKAYYEVKTSLASLIWTDVHFIDDQALALHEMNSYNPEVQLYLIY